MSDLGAIPVPTLDDFEAAVRDQLEASRTAVEQMLADGSRRSDAVEALGNLCLLYLRYELMEAAEPCLRQMRGLEPTDFRWPYYQTILYVRDGDLKEARASVEAALALRPGDVPALLRAGDLYLRASDMEKRSAPSPRLSSASLRAPPRASVSAGSPRRAMTPERPRLTSRRRLRISPREASRTTTWGWPTERSATWSGPERSSRRASSRRSRFPIHSRLASTR